MTSVKKEDETGAIRVIKFEGKDEKWREWSAKTRAIGKLKGWWEAINGAPVDPNDKIPVEARKNVNEKAHHYLLLSCWNEAFLYIKRMRRQCKGCPEGNFRPLPLQRDDGSNQT